MKKKMMNKVVIILEMIVVMLSHCMIVKATNEIEFYTPHSGIISFSHPDRPQIYNYTMLEDYNGNSIYQYSEEEAVTQGNLIRKEPITDIRVIRVLENGYPCKTNQELGIEYPEHAYIATQEAIYMLCDNKAPEKYNTPSVPEQAIIKVAKQIATKALQEINGNNISEIQIIEKADGKEEGEYFVKEYTIQVSKEIIHSNIQIEGGNGIKLMDKEGNEKSSFMNQDTIKVGIPKEQLNQNFQLICNATLKGNSYYLCQDEKQKEYIYLEKGNYEAQSTVSVRNGEVTNLIILNQDNDTKQPIVGNQFRILDEEGNIVSDNLRTDEKGQIQIQNLEKGNYQIQQIQAIDGYIKMATSMNITITGVEKNVQITFRNSKEKIEERTNTSKEVNVVEENKKIIEQEITEITNVYTTNTYHEKINQINETNWYNNRDFINTINRKNVINNRNNSLYYNQIEENNMQEKFNQELQYFNMTREDYINYMDCICLGKEKIPTLPVTGK